MNARRRACAVSTTRSIGPALVLTVAVTGGCATADRPGGRGWLGRSGGAPWTIRCVELQGPQRLRQIEQYAETLGRTAGIRTGDVFVRDESDGFARLYYGTYHRRVDAKINQLRLPRRLREDLDLIREMGDASGRRFFLQAIPVRMPMPDVGDPPWALRNVQATYSLQVAAFVPTDEFWEYKQAAAEFCALLREKGYEAYYHHGGSGSVVTVGAFGAEAVITRIENGRWETFYSPEVLALQRDELLKYNLLNGSIYRARDDQGRMAPVLSRLVKIPQPDEEPTW